MKIELHQIPIRDLIEGYVDNEEEGVFGYGGKLNIRPPYQREFVYKDPQRNAVIDTVLKGFPLNTIYWAKNKEGGFELLDGQQRIVSICKYLNGDFSVVWDGNIHYGDTLIGDLKDKVLNYKLTVYICEGDESEKLAWFRTINIAGEKLTDQELRNAVYAGPWLTEAKKHFSKIKKNTPSDDKKPESGVALWEYYVSANPIRQELLEKVIGWFQNDKSDEAICTYMSKNQHEKNADELWTYFQNVINWANLKFKIIRKELKNVEWGFLYNKYKDEKLDAGVLEDEVARLMQDDEVVRKSGIYEYVLRRDERFLNLRSFPNGLKREVYEAQKGICPHCQKKFELEEMEADHITPWSEGGKTVKENCQMLCRECNRRKSNK